MLESKQLDEHPADTKGMLPLAVCFVTLLLAIAGALLSGAGLGRCAPVLAPVATSSP